ncbi:phage protein [Robinsoniella peoriensis]|uniref:phage protein n=1 Tax=Robinsoniella peoriensis TaxID=180332 RepID=UPI0005C7AE81|nr:phage protein [Robinsoniella peoriensis]
MNQQQVMAMVEEINLPFAYDHFAEGQSPEPPFCVFLYPGARNFSADGLPYFKINRLHVEIYTDFKSAELEEQVEAVLERHDIFYGKSEVWVESERLYEVLYEMEV